MSSKDFVLPADVEFPLKEMRAKLELAISDFQKFKGMCKELLAIQKAHGYRASELCFLKDILPLREKKDPSLYTAYAKESLLCYEEVIEQNNLLASEYLFTIYESNYAEHNKRLDLFLYTAAGCFVIFFIITLLLLLSNSRRKNITDPLTGLYNRKGKHFPFLMCDIDHFKEINDTFGHEAGHEVLGKLSKLFSQQRDPNARFFRLGSEEFCVLYACKKPGEAVAFAEKSTVEVSGGIGVCGVTVTLAWRVWGRRMAYTSWRI